MESRNKLEGRYSGHAFGFHLRATKKRQALSVSHRNAYTPLPDGLELPRARNISWRRAMRNNMRNRSATGAPFDRESTIRITAADAAMIAGLRDSPRPPNAALQRAFNAYKQRQQAAMLGILDHGKKQIAEGKVHDHEEVFAMLDAEDSK